MPMTEEEKTSEYVLKQDEIDVLTKISNNPGLVIEHAYGMLKRATEGEIDIPNPTNPFSYLLECASIQASSLHQSHDVTYRKQYPRLANQYSDLYNHMFDEHYIGRFATPGRAKFDIYFKKEEVFQQLLKTDKNGLRRIVIPRGSYITAQDYLFTLLYPIQITQQRHGDCSIIYLTNKKDPVQPLNSNIIDWSYVTINGVEYFRIRPTLLNVKMSLISDTTVIDGYVKRIKISDRFVHCRVYQKRNDKVEELYTTHSDLVYDASKPTAKLTYLENELKVEIPSIYFNTNLIGTKIFIEVYTTVGKADEPLNEYAPDAFSYQWGKLENNLDDLNYVTPLEQLTSPIILASTMLSGGTNGETFKETRDRVINYAGYVETPITPNQLETSIKIGSYDILKSRDSLTSRSYLATRALPLNKEDNFSAGAAASMETIKTSLEELENHPDVRNNGRRLTITPNMLFKTNNAGIVSVVNPLNNPLYNRNRYIDEEYVGEVNRLQYMFTPFYYVLDPTGNSFDLRAYYMDSPTTYDQIFIGNNHTSELSVGSDEIKIVRYRDPIKRRKNGLPDEGYKIRVKSKTTEAYEKIPPSQLFCQLAVIPQGDKHFASINGKLLGYGIDNETKLKEYVWEFTIPTSWDVTEKDSLIAHDFYMYLNEARKFEIGLTGEFYFIYGVLDYPLKHYQPDEIHRLVNKEIIDDENGFVAISADKVSYRLGWRLRNFWSNGIPVQGNEVYETYDTDIPLVYRQDVYDTDEHGIYIVEGDELRVIHHAGDPVLDKEGNPIYRARKGDIKLDEYGRAIKKQDRKLQYLIDIMMIDGVYYFADAEEDKKYKERIGELVKNYIVEDLPYIHKRLLENTLLYFYPKRTMGEAVLIIDNGSEIQEPMRMSFNVTYYMDEAHYGNMDIRNAIKEKTHEIINKQLTEPTVSIDRMITALRTMGGEDIVSVYVDKFGYSDARKFTTYTSKDPSVRCSVKRLVKLQADNTIKVFEDINVNFIKHENIEELKARG